MERTRQSVGGDGPEPRQKRWSGHRIARLRRRLRSVSVFGLSLLTVGALSLPLLATPVVASGPPPSVTAVVANSGPLSGGQRVTVLGTGLSSPTAVHFGLNLATVLASTNTTVTVTSPVGSAGTVHVSVTTSNGTSSLTSADLYRYVQVPSLYVADSGLDEITPITFASQVPRAPIGVGGTPTAIAITPNGSTALVVDSGSDDVTPVDLPTGSPSASISVGSDPTAIAITPNGATAYVTNSGSGTVTPIATASGTAGTPITVGSDPAGIAITPDGQTAYVAVRGTGHVVPIALGSGTPGTPIAVGSQPTGIAITPDGATVYVTDAGSNQVTPITVSSGAAGTPIGVGTTPVGIAVTPSGRTAFVTNSGSDNVTPIALPSGAAGTPIGVGSTPIGVAFTPDGLTAYVSDSGEDDVTPVTVSTGTAGTPIDVGSVPQGLAVSPDQAPTASFTAVPAVPGSASTFDASASGAPAGTIAQYAWDFGDSSTTVTNSATVSHTYLAAGPVHSRLTVTDSAGTSTIDDIRRSNRFE